MLERDVKPVFGGERMNVEIRASLDPLKVN
jgi:hypothetical protein